MTQPQLARDKRDIKILVLVQLNLFCLYFKIDIKDSFNLLNVPFFIAPFFYIKKRPINININININIKKGRKIKIIFI